MKLLITGASGYLGTRLCELARGRFKIYAGFHSHPERLRTGEPFRLDLGHSVLKQMNRLHPDAIIHTAAVNPGGPVESMPTINTDGSRRIAEAAQALSCRLIHVSTDVVHDGQNAPYDDDAPTSPMGPYASSKALAEDAVRRVHPQAAIVRTSLIYGLHAMDNGTAGFASRLNAGEPVRLFTDVWRQPVWIDTLAEALMRLAETSHSGFFNVAGSQPMTRDDFGRKMLGFWKVEANRVESIQTTDLGIEVPRDLRLRLEHARQALELDMPGVDDVLSTTPPRA